MAAAKVRDSRGGAFASRGRFYMRVTVAPQKRPAKLLPWATTHEEAQERARVTQALVNRLREADQSDFVEKLVESAASADSAKMEALERAVGGIVGGSVERKPVPAKGVLTFQVFAERWTGGELHREYPDHVRDKRSADDDVSRLEKHVYPVIGARPLVGVTLDDALEVMRKLPVTLAPASRRHVAQLMARVFSLAVYPCRVLSASPLPRGFLPKLRRQKAKSALYPDEDARLLGAMEVPIASRMLYGFLAREGMRSSEALRLTWADLDLERGAVRLDRTKTDDVRAWALDVGTAAALVVWRKMRASEPASALVFGHVSDQGHLAGDFRGHLRAAGVSRADLYEDSAARRPIRLHDLRATFVTVALATGRSEAWVSGRTGHRSSGQISAYRRLAQTFADVGAGDFVNMATAIPELAAAANTAANTAAEPGAAPVAVDLTARKCTGRESNSYALRRRNLKTGDQPATSGDRRDNARFVEHMATDGNPLLPALPCSAAASDVDAALVRALDAAVIAGRLDVVGLLTEELRARRLAAAGNVVEIDSGRGSRGA